MTTDTDPVTLVTLPPLSLKKRVANLSKDYEKAIKGEFTTAIEALFAVHPRLKSIDWSAGDEYNDGDSTSFSSNHEEPQINGFDGFEDDSDPANLLKTAEEGDKEAKAATKDVWDTMTAFPGSFYESYFGSGGELKSGRKVKWTEREDVY